MKKYYFLVISLICFIPFSAKASGSYSVQMVSGTSSNRVVGTYNSFAEAVGSMYSQNVSADSVPTIYRDGVPVDSMAAIFKLKPSNVYKLYRDEYTSANYTSISSNYGSDAALLGYSETGRAKIMISGFIGWININSGVVTPISLLSGNMININGGGVRLRTGPSLSAHTAYQISGSNNFSYSNTVNADGYTWYNINYNGSSVWVAGGSWVTRYDTSLGTYYLPYSPTGNLIHHFEEYNGVNYEDSFTNLGTYPSFLSPDVRYYSFDGNYFYDNIISMIRDYKDGSYNRSVNKDNPYYSYYLYLTARSKTGYTKDDLDYIVASKGYGNGKMANTGAYFKEAEETYGTNALLAFSTAINESGWGTSYIANLKNNLFGYGAYDSCPVDCAFSYSSVQESINHYASTSSSNYEVLGGKYYFGSHYGNKSSGKNIMYATDPYWGEKMATSAFKQDKDFGGKDFNSSTIGVVKKGIYYPRVFYSPNADSGSYILESNYGQPVYDFALNVVDKVTENGRTFYKVYTDLKDRNPLYGYILESDLNVSNSQPIINASDREIKVGDGFNYLEGVSATDRENGDVSYSLTYEGTVDTNNVGVYKVKYTAVDKSNFHVSKTINVNVKTNFSVKANDLTYNSNPQPLLTVTSTQSVYYSLDKELDSSNYLEGTTEIPTKIDAGEYIVYYYAPEKDLASSKKVIIKKKDAVNPTVKNYLGIYDGLPHTISVNGGEGGSILYSADGENYTDVLPTFTEIGEYKVYVKTDADNNHNEVDGKKATVKIKSENDINPSVEYQTHVENIGWQDYVEDGVTSGTTGKSLRIEALKIKLKDDLDGSISYSTHVENIGWTDYSSDGDMSGTEGRSLRVEAIRIKLSGQISNYYDVYYRVHAEKYGWLGWAKNGENAGSSGYGYRLEALEVKLVKKGEEINTEGEAYKFPKIKYHTHVEDIGWQDIVSDGQMSGTTGQSKRLEGIKIDLSDELNGEVNYSTHIQNIGWQDYVTDTMLSGTEGMSLRLEAIRIKLTGEVSNKYDIYYRVHAENFGWLGWAKNGEEAGTSGYGYRLEGIEIKLVDKSDEINREGEAYKFPKIKYHTHVEDIGWQDIVSDGELSGSTGQSKRLEGIKIDLSDELDGYVKYSTHIQNIGWQDYVTDTNLSGTEGMSLRLEAIKIKLVGEVSNKYDIYYRVHAEKFGWLGWAKNGEEAGSSGYGYRLEAIQIILVNKGEQVEGYGNAYKAL